MLLDDSALIDIFNASELAISFCEDISKEEFFEDKKTQSAVMHQFIIIGEATKRLSHNLKKKHHQIHWKEIAGMRDKLIHGYDEVDLDIIWNTLMQDITKLISDIKPILPKK